MNNNFNFYRQKNLTKRKDTVEKYIRAFGMEIPEDIKENEIWFVCISFWNNDNKLDEIIFDIDAEDFDELQLLWYDFCLENRILKPDIAFLEIENRAIDNDQT